MKEVSGKGREGAGGARSARQKMLFSVHLTSSPAGDNNGVSKGLPCVNVARFLSG